MIRHLPSKVDSTLRSLHRDHRNGVLHGGLNLPAIYPNLNRHNPRGMPIENELEEITNAASIRFEFAYLLGQ